MNTRNVGTFESLIVWQKARQFCNKICQVYSTGPFWYDFALRDQINRSAGSIMDNIAEGNERDGTREFSQFLSYAKGSAGEVRSQLYRALDRNYLTEELHSELKADIEEISKMLSGLMKYQRTTNFKGIKFKTKP